GRSLDLAAVGAVAARRAQVVLSEEARARVARARALVERRAAGEDPVYGLNTGFGYLARVRIPSHELAQLQLNLIRSHAVGVGEPLDAPSTRVLMLLRANVIATGRAGVRVATLELLLAMLAKDLLPLIPGKGSVGASGDLAPLAHLALAMVGEGEILVDGRPCPSGEVLRGAGLDVLVPDVKEGLGLINGTQAMGAVGSLALLEAERLAVLADVVGAVSLEADRGTPVAFDPRIHQARPHPGQLLSAENLRRLVDDSRVRDSHADCDRVQDPYSFRCMPQVHGATRDTLEFVRRTLSIELNAATDNPLVFAEPGEEDAMLSGGNFHGQPLALALDFLAIAVSELGNISDRRVEQLIDPSLSQLPAFLVENPGLHSGFMMAQVTAAALVNENKVLAHPASVDSIPTSANREDHVSMGMTSARKAATVVANTQTCLVIELLCACQALDFLKLPPGRGVAAAHRAVREVVPFMNEDRVLYRDVAALEGHIRDGHLIAAVEAEIGPLD
ncbi:MAG: histidine ammonia-lyase, partial [Myxococcota bacterium]